MRELVALSPLPLEQLRRALLVLTQHNCVAVWQQPAEPTVRGERPATFLYEAQLSAMLVGIRCVCLLCACVCFVLCVLLMTTTPPRGALSHSFDDKTHPPPTKKINTKKGCCAFRCS